MKIKSIKSIKSTTSITGRISNYFLQKARGTLGTRYSCGTLSSGFTLIELLISMAVLMVVGSIMIIVFFSTLRGTGKSQVLISVRQNGNYALSQMSRQIRMAESAVCQNDGTVDVTSALDHEVTTYKCTETNIASSTAVQDFFLLDDTQVKAESCSFTCGEQAPLDIPYVTIQFDLTNADNLSLPEQRIETPVTFTTTVLLRNAVDE